MTTHSPTLSLRGLALASAVLGTMAAWAGDAPAAVTAGIKDSNRTLDVKVGGTVSIRLAAQLGTGYRWHLASKEASVLAQEGDDKVEPSDQAGKAEPVVGGPETQVFTFNARAAGKADLKFQYYREFEAGKKPLRSATFHIKVVAPKG